MKSFQTSINTISDLTSDDVGAVASQPAVATDLPVAYQELVELEGTTCFSPPPAPTFRYRLLLKREKLRVWLEDCASKKQWRSGELSLGHYIDLDNAVPDGRPTEYAVCFHELLSKIVEQGEAYPRRVNETEGGVLCLELSMKMQFLTRTRVATYSFELLPISVDRVGILESRVRDLEEEAKQRRLVDDYVNQLRSEFDASVNKLRQDFERREKAWQDAMTASSAPVIIRARAFELVAHTKTIQWKKVEKGKNINGNDGIIRNLQPGTYQVNVHVHCPTGKIGSSCRLMRGKTTIERAYFSNNKQVSTIIASVVRVALFEELSVKSDYHLDGSVPSHITLIRVGN